MPLADIPAPGFINRCPMDRDFLTAFVDYDPITGGMVWLHRGLAHFPDERAWKSWNSKNAGRPAFATKARTGYLVGSLLKSKILAHRVAWIFTNGAIPAGCEIDHINGERTDNRIANLRLVQPGENQKNKALSSKNTSGFHGVSWSKRDKRWYAKLKTEGVTYRLGGFKNKDDAVVARKAAEKKLGFHENHGRPLKMDEGK